MKKPFRCLSGIITLSFAIVLLFGACKKNNSGSEEGPGPEITSFHPAVTAPGGTIVIRGNHFSSNKDAINVSINGRPASVFTADSTELAIIIPSDASSGKLTVMVDQRSVTTSGDLIINANAPVISEITPATAAVGEEVSVTGRNFNEDLLVFIGDKTMELVRESATSFKVIIPEGAVNNRLRVRSAGMEALSPARFYTPARITSLSAQSGIDGDTIAINGENFSIRKTDVQVFFGENPATAEDIVSLSATEIKVKAPVAGTNGQVLIKQYGTTSNGSSFSYIPSITSFEPAIVEPGTVITIRGHRFGPGNIVRFNGYSGEALEITPNTIRARVPAGPTGGRLEVRAGNRSVFAPGELQFVNVWTTLEVSNPQSNPGSTLFVIGSKAYFIGVYSMRVFDLTTNTWSDGSLPDGWTGRYASAAEVINGKAYVGTGGFYENGRLLKDWWEFNPASATPWKRMTDFPEATSYGIAFKVNNTIYAGLGQLDDHSSAKRLYPFNPEGNGSWGAPTSFDQFNSVPNMTFTIGGTPYFGIGQNLYKFEPGSENPAPRIAGFPVSNYSGYVSLYRSLNAGTKGYLYFLGRFFDFDPATSTWSELSSMYLSYSSNIININNRIIAFDGTGVYEYIPRP